VAVNLNAELEQTYRLRTGSVTNEAFWAITILHELGHVLGGLISNDGDVSLGTTNNSTVIQNPCGSL